MTLTQAQKRLFTLRLGTLTRPEKLTLLALMELSLALTEWLNQLDQQIDTLIRSDKPREEGLPHGNN